MLRPSPLPPINALVAFSLPRATGGITEPAAMSGGPKQLPSHHHAHVKQPSHSQPPDLVANRLAVSPPRVKAVLGVMSLAPDAPRIDAYLAEPQAAELRMLGLTIAPQLSISMHDQAGTMINVTLLQ